MLHLLCTLQLFQFFIFTLILSSFHPRNNDITWSQIYSIRINNHFQYQEIIEKKVWIWNDENWQGLKVWKIVAKTRLKIVTEGQRWDDHFCPKWFNSLNACESLHYIINTWCKCVEIKAQKIIEKLVGKMSEKNYICLWKCLLDLYTLKNSVKS